MGLDPATALLISGAAAAGGPVLSNLFAPEGQDLRSFRNSSVDPVAMLTNAHSLINRVGRATGTRAGQPVSVRSGYVQQPSVMTGGGLPMPIGLTASDPALTDSSLLSLPGMEGFGGLFDNMKTGSPDGDDDPNDNEGWVDKDGYHDDPNAPPPDPDGRRAVPRQTGAAAGTQRRQPGTGLRAADLMGDDDLDQAFGAVNLLLESMR